MIFTNQKTHLSEQVWDVIVIGSGPAGAAVASQIKTYRDRVLLVDRRKLPFHKLCGCCLSPTATEELSAMGIDFTNSEQPSVPLERCLFKTNKSEIEMCVDKMAVISRERLDAELIKHASNLGVIYQDGLNIREIHSNDREGTRELHGVLDARKGSKRIRLKTRAVIDASGLPAKPTNIKRKSLFSSRIGIGTVIKADAFPLPTGQLIMLVAPFGYCGLVRLENGCIDIAAALDTEAVKNKKPWQALETIFIHTSVDIPVETKSSSYLGKPYLTRNMPLFDNRCYRVGDAAGYVEPLTGEGIGWALKGARALSEAFGNFDPTIENCQTEIGRTYSRLRHRMMRRDLQRCRLLTLATRNRWLLNMSMATARHAPFFTRLIFPHVRQTVTPNSSSN